MKIDDLDNHRMDKIKSLLIDRAEYEKSLFLKSLKRLQIPRKDKAFILETIDFTLNQNYGEGKLYKFYAPHPVRVARFGVEWLSITKQYSLDFINCCLIHNTIEKELLTYSEIKSIYGEWCADTIKVLTVDRECQKESTWAHTYYSNISELDPHGQMVKVFDKFDNIYAICLNPDDRVRKNYIDEIAMYIYPILTKNAPYLSSYFKNLIDSSVLMGYKPTESFMKEFN